MVWHNCVRAEADQQAITDSSIAQSPPNSRLSLLQTRIQWCLRSKTRATMICLKRITTTTETPMIQEGHESNFHSNWAHRKMLEIVWWWQIWINPNHHNHIQRSKASMLCWARLMLHHLGGQSKSIRMRSMKEIHPCLNRVNFYNKSLSSLQLLSSKKSIRIAK